MGLEKYNAKRDFKKTPEPRGKIVKHKGDLIFVVQKHHAKVLHYDVRLELDGVLLSWAVPKGPSFNPKDKRLAVRTEDHPLDYATFEGSIPEGEYGAGHMIVWDYGTWIPQKNVKAGLKKGHIDFELKGSKLHGKWTLVRLREKEGKENWLLFKRQDSFARSDYDVTTTEPHSVLRKVKARTVKSPPHFIEPQLAQLVDKVPSGGQWLHEIKFDGYRTLCRIDKKGKKGKVKLLTRSGKDWTEKYGELCEEMLKLNLDNAILDGELVVLNEEGHSDFQRLQNALSEGKTDRLVYYLFDIIFFDGEDLREKPLIERKEILKKILKPLKKSPLLYSEHWLSRGAEMFKQSCQLKLEGVVSKDAHAPYLSGRSAVWQKTKCSLRQELVIGGYSESESGDRPFAALLMGVYDDDKKLRYVGKVGTGYTQETLSQLFAKFKKLETDESPFDLKSPRGRGLHWLKPKLIGEVEFKAWTGDGILRQASFQGLREDKPTKEIHVEKPKVKITHPERVVYKKTKTKKMDVLKYYEAITPMMFPFIEDRPLSILRCQENTSGGCYFQKHSEGRNLVGIESKPVHYKEKSDTALVAQSPVDVIELAQAGVVEIHAWGAQFAHITKPDLIVFDLDPESAKLWGKVVDTAFVIKEMLEKLGLKSFVKVTGGKGLHVQVPILPLYNWDQIKNFSKSLMTVLEHQEPQNYTTNMNKSKRKGRIFLDYLRNGYGATAVVPYSLRAREYPTVALPIAWKELKKSLSPDQYLLEEVIKMMKRRKDPWANYWDLQQRIKILDKKEFSLSDSVLS